MIEFFWYGCSHCQDLDPDLSKWVKDHSANVQFTRIPAFLGSWSEDAKIYFALLGAGLKDEQNIAIFDFYAKRASSHGSRPNLNDVIEVAKKLGLEENKIRDSYNSFDTSNKLRLVKEILKFYHIDGVPNLLVNKTYITGASYVETPNDILIDLTLATSVKNKITILSIIHYNDIWLIKNF